MAQTTLVTPAARKRFSTFRHMAMYWAGVPPVAFGFR